MPKVFTSKSQRTGEIGEHLAVRYLENKGFSIIERNYTKKWGEIDIVAKARQVLHFIEVKTISASSLYRAEENMNHQKVERLKRTIQTYLLSHEDIVEWQFDLVTVVMDKERGEAKIHMLENLIL